MGGNAGLLGWQLIGYSGPRHRLDGGRPAPRPVGAGVNELPVADVVLVGLGGAGGIAAQVLTGAGLDVVALEAGPRLGPGSMTFDELRNDVHGWLSDPKSRHEVPTQRFDGPAPAAGSVADADGERGRRLDPPLPGSQHTAPTLELPQPQRHARPVRPGGDPRGLDTRGLAARLRRARPWYDAVERAIGVAGRAATCRERRSARQSVRGPEAAAIRCRRCGATAGRADGRCGAGARLASVRRSRGGQLGAVRRPPGMHVLRLLLGNGCYSGARGSTDVNVIPRAEATGRLRVETAPACSASRPATAASSPASPTSRTASSVASPREPVLLGTFVYENVRLLLLSTSTGFPRGLANNAGCVGKHFTAHVTPVVYGVFPEHRLNLFNGLWAQATCVDDWNADNFDHTGLGFVGGGMLAAPQEAKPIATASVPPPPGVPRWGAGWKRWLRASGPSLAYAVGQFDALTYESNFLDLDPAVVDPDGVPIVRITTRLLENERRGHDFLRDKLEQWLRARGGRADVVT